MALAEFGRRRYEGLALAAPVVVALLGLAPPACADDWDPVMRLRTGERVRIQLFDAARVSGTLVSVEADALSLVIRGTPSVARRDQVRRVERDRAVPRSLPWLGMAIGAVWMGSTVAQVSDFTALGRAFWTGIGAGLGGIAGGIARHATRFSPVYQASSLEPQVGPLPTHEVAGVSPLPTRGPEGFVMPSGRSAEPSFILELAR